MGVTKNPGIDFSKMPCVYWSESTKISYLQRRIIVYSIMYYELGGSCIPDFEYEAIVKQLARMQSEADESTLQKTRYNYVMYDFDGSTGFYLYSRLTDEDKELLMSIAKSVLYQQRKERAL